MAAGFTPVSPTDSAEEPVLVFSEILSNVVDGPSP